MTLYVGMCEIAQMNVKKILFQLKWSQHLCTHLSNRKILTMLLGMILQKWRYYMQNKWKKSWFSIKITNCIKPHYGIKHNIKKKHNITKISHNIKLQTDCIKYKWAGITLHLKVCHDKYKLFKFNWVDT